LDRIEPAFRLFFENVALSQQGRNMAEKGAIWANFWSTFVGMFPPNGETPRILSVLKEATSKLLIARE